MANPCRDCKMNTCPYRGDKTGRWEWYMVHNEIWDSLGLPKNNRNGVYLCVGCLERRIGRQLVPADFSSYPVNDPSPINTSRLMERLGYIVNSPV